MNHRPSRHRLTAALAGATANLPLAGAAANLPLAGAAPNLPLAATAQNCKRWKDTP